MKKITSLLFAAAFAAGCASTPQTIAVHVSDPHPAVPVQSVALVTQAPPGSVLIAELFASGANSHSGAEAAQKDMKKNAAAVGANVLVVQSSNGNNYGLGAYDDFRIEGYAYFAPPENK